MCRFLRIAFSPCDMGEDVLKPTVGARSRVGAGENAKDGLCYGHGSSGDARARLIL